MIHYQKQKCGMYSFMQPYTFGENSQDSATNERLPEQNVSIVETLEGKEDNMSLVGSLPGTMRKKLYFNPAYLEPQLLLVSIIYNQSELHLPMGKFNRKVL